MKFFAGECDSSVARCGAPDETSTHSERFVSRTSYITAAKIASDSSSDLEQQLLVGPCYLRSRVLR